MTFKEYLGFDPVFDEYPDNWYIPVTILPYAGYTRPKGCTTEGTCRNCENKTCQTERPQEQQKLF